MKITTHWVAALFVVATFIPALWPAPSSAQKRTLPPKTAPAPAPQSRKPAPDTPPAQAVPRPPAARPPARPAPRSPGRPLESRSLIYPYYFYDFDFVYRFPYGLYPYSRYPYTRTDIPFLCRDARQRKERPMRGAFCVSRSPQKEAAVFIDGFYVGAVEDFNGPAEPLTLPPGPHHLELRAAGYQTLTFEVNIQAGKTITYRAPMQPVS